jgi:hypothetical protein
MSLPADLLVAVVSALTAAFPAAATVAEYPRLRQKIAVPALLLELADASEADDPGTGELALVVRLALRVVLDRAPTAAGQNPDAEALALAAAAAVSVKNAYDFGLDKVGPAHGLRLEPDHFRPDLANYAVWLVEWEHELRLGTDAWASEGVLPREVWLGLSPDVGVPHEPDYTLLGPPRATLAGVPASPTEATTATLVVGGAGVTHYRWRLDGGAWSAKTPVADEIALTDLAVGPHAVVVVGAAYEAWQPDATPTEAAWIIEAPPPEDPGE